MPRSERRRSKTGIYHVMLRGINKQLLFEETADFVRFLDYFSIVKEISKFKLYAYCLMGNHIHLLLKEGEEPLSQVFKRLGARYVFWFNKKYDRSGHLFQDRYRSEPIESDEYFRAVLTYIYQNPVKAGLCKFSKDYAWCSRRLLGAGGLVDEADLFEIVSIGAIEELENKENATEFLEPKVGRKMAMSDESAFMQLKDLSGVKSVSGFQSLHQEVQARIFFKLRGQGVSIRQLVRLSGLSKGVVERICRIGQDA